ncbi:MAG: aminotransferase class I/II-fold pyridoxal phosphate-dependent enzyme [Cellulophaga sp.]
MVHLVDTNPGRELIIQNQKYLYFGGTAYLGLQTDVEFQTIYINNVKKYGTNYGASRKSNIQFSVYEEAELKLTELVGCEASTTLSSGFLAGQFVSSFFNTEEYKLFYAPNSHPALYQNNSKPVETYTALQTLIQEHLTSKSSSIPVLFLDSIDFSGCNYPEYLRLQSLPLDKLILVIDDSHGIGITGEKGGGSYRKVSTLQPKELIICGSLGKGYGILAGAVFGTKNRIAQLTGTAFFGGASPATPASMATFLDSLEIYSTKRDVLKERIVYFKKHVTNIENFSYMKNHAAFSFSNNSLTNYLENNYIIITNFNYPFKDSPLMSRIVLSAHHTEKDMDKLIKLTNAFH